MNASDFQMMATMLKEQSGLVITPEKAYLVENRLQPVARKWGFGNLDQLANSIADFDVIVLIAHEGLFHRFDVVHIAFLLYPSSDVLARNCSGPPV